MARRLHSAATKVMVIAHAKSGTVESFFERDERRHVRMMSFKLIIESPANRI